MLKKSFVLCLLFSFCLFGCGEETAPESVVDSTPEIVQITHVLTPEAEVYCVDNGGVVEMMVRPDGAEYWVCDFGAGERCELEALYSGLCPIGGARLTSSRTPERIYCAMIGGDPNLYEPICHYAGMDCELEPLFERGECL